MSQSKTMSLVEAITNTLVGLALAFAVNAALMHWTGVTATAMQNFLIVAGHTVVSVLRSYVIRRLFNAGWRDRAKQFAGRASCWYGQHGRGAPILHSPPACVGCKRCNERDALRAKFDEESA